MPGAQTALLLCNIEDVFWGGARAAGKTEAMIGAWLQHMVTYGQNVRGLYFRKSFPEMQQVWSRMVEVYEPTGAKSNRSDWTFTWPGGANLTLKYLENEDDAARVMGFSTTMHIYDEAGQWPEPGPIDRLYATLRSPHGIPCIRRLTGNPGGPGTQWLKERYVDPAPPLTPFRWAPNPDRPDLTIELVFIPATLDQNVILKEKDPGYEARLAGIGDSELFKAWRHGDWNVLAGRYFSSFKESRNVEEPIALSPWYTRWIAIDHGFAHDAAAVWAAFDGTTVHVYREFSANELTVPELCKAIVSMTGKDEQIQAVFLSPDAANRRSSPRTIEQEMRENLPWTLRKADNDRLGGWSLMQSMFKFGTLKVFSDCKRLIKWLGTAQRDPKRPEDVLKRDGDDLGDALRYAIKTSEIIPAVPAEVLYEQRILPHIQAGNGMKALIERFKLDEELRKGGKPISPRGKRRR